MVRIGNSSVLLVQEFAALWIEVVLTQGTEIPTLVASLITRPDEGVEVSSAPTGTTVDNSCDDTMLPLIKTIVLGVNSMSSEKDVVVKGVAN